MYIYVESLVEIEALEYVNSAFLDVQRVVKVQVASGRVITSAAARRFVVLLGDVFTLLLLCGRDRRRPLGGPALHVAVPLLGELVGVRRQAGDVRRWAGRGAAPRHGDGAAAN